MRAKAYTLGKVALHVHLGALVTIPTFLQRRRAANSGRVMQNQDMCDARLH